MATKRPPSSDFDDPPIDPKRFCPEGSVQSRGTKTSLPLPPASSTSIIPSVSPPVPVTESSSVSLPLSSGSLSIPVNVVQGTIAAPSLSSSLWHVPTLDPKIVTLRQESECVLPCTSDSSTSTTLASSSSPHLSSPTQSQYSAVPLSSVSVFPATNIANRQPICLVDANPSIIKDQNSFENTGIMKGKMMNLSSFKLKHDNLLKEVFFMKSSGGNLIEYLLWRKKTNMLYDDFLTHESLDFTVQPQGILELQQVHTSSAGDALKSSENTATLNVTTTSIENVSSLFEKQPSKSPLALESHIIKPPSFDVSSDPPSATTVQIPLSTVSPGFYASPPKRATPMSLSRSISFPSSSPRPATRAQASFSSVYENSHEDIVMRARQEAEVIKSVSELRKEGMWSVGRLPKVQEPVRIKTHWDYLLEEMQWLATDFGNEKRWKMNAARKVCLCVCVCVFVCVCV